MKILYKKQIDNYRYSVVKIIFLMTENRYEFIEDFMYSNLMLLKDKKKEQKVYVSLLSKPSTNKYKDYKTIVFYESNSFRELDSKDDNIISHLKFSKEFEKKFPTDLESAFTNVEKFFDNLEPKYRELIKKYCLNENNTIFEELSNRKPYKYYLNTSVENNRYNINDGNLSFSHLKYFNDPFDCNYFLANNTNMSDRFRVLCLTEKYDNILMWSYYSGNHKGYCFEFSYTDIFKKIKSLEIKGLCIFGKVSYRNKRPEIKSQVNKFSYTDLKFYIDVVFTKYAEWEHEDEYRFAIISDEVMNDYVELAVDIEKVYVGCSVNKSPILNSKKQKRFPIQLLKDDKYYKLK